MESPKPITDEDRARALAVVLGRVELKLDTQRNSDEGFPDYIGRMLRGAMRDSLDPRDYAVLWFARVHLPPSGVGP